MSKKKEQTKGRRIACFTPEQQAYYDGLSLKQRRYVDFRGNGYNKTQSYAMAGYAGVNQTQAAHNLESRDKGIAELIETLLAVKKAKAVMVNDETDEINKRINALALQDGVEHILAAVGEADSETARRIQFYRDIINGKIKSVKKVTKRNAMGAVVSTTIEEFCDIESRIKARRELDRVLGLNKVVDLDSLKVGDITINIVDASKKEELDDNRNKIMLDPEKVEEVDGEKVVIVDEQDQKGGEEPQQAPILNSETETYEAVGGA